jgi:peptide/nickel transport system substrate-binding protein
MDAEPDMGGTLVIASTSDIDNYDPHWNQLIAYNVLVGHNIFEYLTMLDANMSTVPSLAASWEISEDGTEYTFHLRDGATFHNGRALTADDVVYSFNRLTEQETIFASKMDPVVSIEALDGATVKFTLQDAWAPFLEDVAAIAIVAEETIDTINKEPIGSGPFRFVEWQPNDRIVLEKNPDYSGSMPAHLDGIEIKILPDYTVALTNLEAGSVDAVYEVPAADADRFKGRDEFVIQTPDASNSLFLLEMSINRYEPLQDARVRRALAMSLDKSAIQQNVYFGQGAPQSGSLPRSSWAYVEGEEIAYDPAGAKALLAEAGYPDGFDLTIKVIAGVAVMENVATIWQNGLAEAGVNLTVEIEDLSTWLDNYVGRTYQTIANWMNVGGDPHSMYDIIFKPHLKDPESYPDEEMLGWIAEGAATPDLEARKAIYQKIQERVLSEVAPVIVVQSQPLLAITTDKVQGWTMNGKGDIFFTSITVME